MSRLKLRMLGQKICMLQLSLCVLQQNLASEEANDFITHITFMTFNCCCCWFLFKGQNPSICNFLSLKVNLEHNFIFKHFPILIKGG